MKNRGGYEIYASIPLTMPLEERDIFSDVCKENEISTITAINETTRVKKLKGRKFQIIIVGNVGTIEQIADPSALVIMVYHGIGLKQTYYRDITDRIDIRVVESKERYDILQKQGQKNLVLTGYTKCDPLIEYDNSQADILDKLGLDPTKKTVLYAPSFYPSSIEKISPELAQFSNEFNLIIKLHNFSWFQKRYQYQSVLIRTVTDNLKNSFLAQPSDIDVIPYMLASDLLISDISSTIFEFLPLDRPIIMAECFSIRLKHRIFKRRFKRKLDLDRFDAIDFVYRINEPAQLNGLVYHAIEYPDEMSKVRVDAGERYLYKTDGKASIRLLDAIEEDLQVK
jgi:CDP-glycerol glycerophosphotransferase (TagB/SpsB family)